MAGILLNAQRIRFACDASKPFGANVTDALTNLPIALPSGSALQLELIFSFGALLDASLLDLSIYSAVNVQFQDNADPHNGTIFYAGSVVAANFATPTVSDWQTNVAAKSHILLAIPAAQNVVPAATTNYWICIYGVLAAGGDPVLLFATNITGKDSGVPVGASVLSTALKLGGKLPFICSPANGGDGLTRDLIIGPGPVAGSWITKINQAGYNGPGQIYYSFLCDPTNGGDGLFRDAFLQLQDGSYDLAIKQNGHS